MVVADTSRLGNTTKNFHRALYAFYICEYTTPQLYLGAMINLTHPGSYQAACVKQILLQVELH